MTGAASFLQAGACALVFGLAGAFLTPHAARAAEPLVERQGRPGEQDRRSVLLGHGINPTVSSLVAFLEGGFSQSAVARGLPTDPRLKSDILNVAIQHLGFEQATAAVPVLSQITEGTMPLGTQRIINRDVERLPVDQAGRLRQIYSGTVQMNAIVALGLIGDPAGAESVRAASRRAPSPGFTVEAAIALGLMNDRRALEELMTVLRSPESDALEYGFQGLFFLTGRNYGVNDQTSIARRRQVVDEAAEWYRSEGQFWVPDRTAILRRRAEGVGDLRPPLTTLRGALKASRRFQDYDLRYAARQRLAGLGPGDVADLRAIVQDPYEDNDVRQSAMQYYAALDPKEAKKDLKRIAKRDENPAVAARAEALLTDIDELLKAG
ncbi:MAG: hypothetical protein RLY93_01555 [Sumerlaeia bacterium]